MATLGRYQLLRPIVVGLVHGLAGSAAVALLVLATIQDTGHRDRLPRDLLHRGGGRDGGPDDRHRAAVHGVGGALGQDQPLADGRLRAALAPFGLLLVYEIGFVGGLFTGDFKWEPA